MLNMFCYLFHLLKFMHLEMLVDVFKKLKKLKKSIVSLLNVTTFL